MIYEFSLSATKTRRCDQSLPKLWASSYKLYGTSKLAGMPAASECDSPLRRGSGQRLDEKCHRGKGLLILGQSRADKGRTQDSCLQTRAARTFYRSRLSWRP